MTRRHSRDGCATMIKTASEVKTIDLRKYDAAPYNPRAITDEARAGLKASLEQHGYVDLIIVNRRTRHVIGGHQRREVLLEAGRVRVPAIVVDLDETAEKAMNLSLNNPHIAGHFTAELEPLLAELRAAMPAEDVLALRLEELRQGIVTMQTPCGDADDAELAPIFELVVECGSESEQKRFYDRLTRQGHKCRVLTM